MRTQCLIIYNIYNIHVNYVNMVYIYILFFQVYQVSLLVECIVYSVMLKFDTYLKENSP